MSVFGRQQQLGFPAANDKTVAQLLGILQRKVQHQTTAATSASDFLGQFESDGVVGDIYVVVKATGGALGVGESMVYDVQVDGTSVLTATLTVNAASDLTRQISFASLLDSNHTSGKLGQVATVVRTYTAGSGAKMLDNSVTLEYSDHWY